MRVTWVTLWGLNSHMYVAYRPTLCATEESGFTYISAPAEKIDVGTETGVLAYHIYSYTAVMTDIRAECVYEYAVGTTFLWSEIYYFKGTTPDYDTPYEQVDMETTALIFGDWGAGPNGKNTSAMMNNFAEMRSFDVVLHVGDMAYDL